jgi:hypothetical protein
MGYLMLLGEAQWLGPPINFPGAGRPPGQLLSWDGSVKLPVYVTVTDAVSGRPIVDATVTLLPPQFRSRRPELYPDPPPELKTDARGRAVLKQTYPAGGSVSDEEESAGVFVQDAKVRCAAKNYETTEQFLSKSKNGSLRFNPRREPYAVTLRFVLSPK